MLNIFPARLVRSAVFVAVAFAATPAFASPETDRAEALYTNGKDAMARGDFTTACSLLAESLALDPAVGTMLNLATCEERSGKVVSALTHFRTARAQLAKDDFRIAFADEHIRALSLRVAHLVLRAPSPREPELRILRDGVAVPPALLDVAVEVDPGRHVVVVERRHASPARIDLELREGEAKVVELPPKGAAPEARETGEVATTTTGPTPLAYVFGGIGLAGVVTGTVFGLVAMNAASNYRAHCTAGECDPEGLSAASAGRTASVVSPVAFALGAVGLGVGVTLFFATRGTKARAASVLPMVSTSGGGVLVVRRF